METSTRGRYQRIYTLSSTDQLNAKKLQYIWNFLTEQLILICVTENVIKIF